MIRFNSRDAPAKSYVPCTRGHTDLWILVQNIKRKINIQTVESARHTERNVISS